MASTPKRIIETLSIINIRLWIIIIGFAGIIVTYSFPHSQISETLRHVFITISVLLIIEHIAETRHKKHFVETMNEGINDVLKKNLPIFISEIEKSLIISLENNYHLHKNDINEGIYTSLRAQIPERYKDIAESGICDTYSSLDITKLQNKLKRVNNTGIFILKIWAPYLDAFRDILVDAINNRNCTVKICLVDPNYEQALKARAILTPYENYKLVQEKIEQNIKMLINISSKLKEKNKLMFRIHRNFIGGSLIGYGKTILLGLYLDGRLATEGTILKVRGAESTSFFYDELINHFNSQWEKSIDYSLD